MSGIDQNQMANFVTVALMSAVLLTSAAFAEGGGSATSGTHEAGGLRQDFVPTRRLDHSDRDADHGRLHCLLALSFRKTWRC
jgi:hypothetical protein